MKSKKRHFLKGVRHSYQLSLKVVEFRKREISLYVE